MLAKDQPARSLPAAVLAVCVTALSAAPVSVAWADNGTSAGATAAAATETVEAEAELEAKVEADSKAKNLAFRYFDPTVARLVSWSERLWPTSRETSERLDELAAIASLIGDNNPPRGWEWVGYGTGTAGAAAGQGVQSTGLDTELAVGGEVALAGRDCKLIAMGAQGVLAISGDDKFASAEQWIRLCPWKGLNFSDGKWEMRWFPLSLHAEASQRTRPAFGSRRAFLGDTYDSIRIGFELVGGQFYWNKGASRFGFAGAAVEEAWYWQDLGEGRTNRYFLTGDMWFFRFDRFRNEPDVIAHRTIDILAFGFTANRDDNGAAIVEAMPLRMRGMSLGTPYVLWDFEIGFTGTGTVGSQQSLNGEVIMDDTIETENLPHITAGVIRASVYGGTPARHVGLSYDRQMQPTAASELVLEDRVSAWSRWTGERSGLDLRAFIGHTYIWPARTTEEKFTIGGGAARFHYAISPRTLFGVDLEGGYSFYAPGYRGGKFEPGLGFRAIANLTMRRFGSDF